MLETTKHAWTIHLARDLEEFGDNSEDAVDLLCEMIDHYSRAQAIPDGVPAAAELLLGLRAALFRLQTSAGWLAEIAKVAGIHYETRAALLLTKSDVVSRKYRPQQVPPDDR